MRLLITGGAGFVGANVSALAVARGHTCVVLDDLSTGRADNLRGLPVRLVEGDIRDADLVGRLEGETDSVVHLAGVTGVPPSLEDPHRTHEVNVGGTLTLLEAMRRSGAGHLVLASSAAVYGATPTQPQHECLPPAPASPYAASKLAAEQYALAWTTSFGLPVLALRFFNVYGPLQAADHGYAAVVPAFLTAWERREPLIVEADGLQTRDLTYVDIVTHAICLAVEQQLAHPGPVNLASGSRHTILDVAAALQDVTGASLQIRHTSPRPADVRHSCADVSLLRRLLPELPGPTLQEGLSRTLEWWRGRQPSR